MATLEERTRRAHRHSTALYLMAGVAVWPSVLLYFVYRGTACWGSGDGFAIALLCRRGWLSTPLFLWVMAGVAWALVVALGDVDEAGDAQLGAVARHTRRLRRGLGVLLQSTEATPQAHRVEPHAKGHARWSLLLLVLVAAAWLFFFVLIPWKFF